MKKKALASELYDQLSMFKTNEEEPVYFEEEEITTGTKFTLDSLFFPITEEGCDECLIPNFQIPATVKSLADDYVVILEPGAADKLSDEDDAEMMVISD